MDIGIHVITIIIIALLLLNCGSLTTWAGCTVTPLLSVDCNQQRRGKSPSVRPFVPWRPENLESKPGKNCGDRTDRETKSEWVFNTILFIFYSFPFCFTKNDDRAILIDRNCCCCWCAFSAAKKTWKKKNSSPLIQLEIKQLINGCRFFSAAAAANAIDLHVVVVGREICKALKDRSSAKWSIKLANGPSQKCILRGIRSFLPHFMAIIAMVDLGVI